MTSNSRPLVCALACVACLLSASAAHAQSEDDALLAGLATSSTFAGTYGLIVTLAFAPLTTTVVGGGIVLTILGKEASSTSGVTVLRMHLEHNEPAVREAIVSGAGPQVADLGDLFAIPTTRRAAFGAMLRARRARLAPLVHAEMTDAEALAFAQCVAEGMRDAGFFENF